MDGVDLQILRRMGVAPFLVWPHPPASLRPAAVGRALGLSADTVKRRLAALRRAGAYHGTMVVPNPRLFGLRMASFHVHLGEEARRRVTPEAVAALPGVLGVFDMVGGDRCVDAAFGDDAGRDQLLERLADLLGASSSHFVDYAAPLPTGKRTPLDWRLLQALRAAPDTSLEAAAKAVGVSVRTAKRRFDRMAADGCLDVIAVFDPGALPGHFLVDLVFRLAPGAGRSDLPAILNAFKGRWVAQWSPPDQRLGHLTLVVVASTPREVEDLRREGESMPSVERCQALVFEGVHETWGWLDSEIQRRAEVTVANEARPVSPAVTVPARKRRAAPSRRASK